jgi:hypothetical protein
MPMEDPFGPAYCRWCGSSWGTRLVCLEHEQRCEKRQRIGTTGAAGPMGPGGAGGAGGPAGTVSRHDPLIERLRDAVEIEGPHVTYHRETMARHREEWPTVWKAIDALIERDREEW